MASTPASAPVVPAPAVPSPSQQQGAGGGEDDVYYRDLLNRVDQQLFLSRAGPGLVTFGGREEEDAAVETPPATCLGTVLSRHSVLGTCWHLELENTFTRPLKVYFVLSSLLLVVFLSIKVRLATSFAEFFVVSVLLNAAHFVQRACFFRFQTSLFLWPFFAAVFTLTLAIWDLVLVVRGGAESLHHAVGVAIGSYLFGFMLPEAIGRAVQWQRVRVRVRGAVPSPAGTEDYSIL